MVKIISAICVAAPALSEAEEPTNTPSPTATLTNTPTFTPTPTETLSWSTLDDDGDGVLNYAETSNGCPQNNGGDDPGTGPPPIGEE